MVVNAGSTACNINVGTHAERIYICYKREMHGNPIVDLQVILPSKGETIPKNFTMIEKSVTGAPANLNSGTNAPEVFLCYRQQMHRLKCLGEEPGDMNEEESVLVSRLRQRRQTITSSGAQQSADDLDTRVRSSGIAYSPMGRSGGIAASMDSPGKLRRSATVNVSPLKIILSEDAMSSAKFGSRNPSPEKDAQDARRQLLSGSALMASRSDDNVLHVSGKLRQVALHELRRSSQEGGFSSGFLSGTAPADATATSSEAVDRAGKIDPLTGSSGFISVESHDSESTRSLSPRGLRRAGFSTEQLAAADTPTAAGAAAAAGHRRDGSLMSAATSGSDLMTLICDNDDLAADADETASAVSNSSYKQQQQQLSSATHGEDSIRMLNSSPLPQRRESVDGSVNESVSSRNSSPRVANLKSIHAPVQIGLSALNHPHQQSLPPVPQSSGGSQRSSGHKSHSTMGSQPPLEPPPPLLSPFSPSVFKTVEGVATFTSSSGIAAAGSASTSDCGASSSDGIIASSVFASCSSFAYSQFMFD